MKSRMPALFIGHGSPQNAITENAFHRAWVNLGATLPRPGAILCISAHWETQGTHVTAGEWPRTIHDFRGFPEALFSVKYGAPGAPLLAQRVADLLAPHKVHLNIRRGLDHGAWGVLRPMFPKADIPVVQLSIDTAESGNWHYALARRLRPLRNEGVLIIGSGNIVHNLPLWDGRASAPAPWGKRFNSVIKNLLEQRDHSALCAWKRLGADAALSVPTPEHYLPLLYVAAQQDENDPLHFETDEVLGTIGMTSVVIGWDRPSGHVGRLFAQLSRSQCEVHDWEPANRLRIRAKL